MRRGGPRGSATDPTRTSERSFEVRGHEFGCAALDAAFERSARHGECVGRLAVAALLVLAGASIAVAAADLAILTGGAKGTYYQFGLNLQGLAK